MTSHDTRRWLLASSLLGATALVSACGSAPATQTTERTVTTTTAPAPAAMMAPPLGSTTTTTTRTQSQTP